MIWRSICDGTRQRVLAFRSISHRRNFSCSLIWCARPAKWYRALRLQNRCGKSDSKLTRTWSMSLCAACAQRWTIRSRPSLSIPSAALAMFSKHVNPRSIASQLILLFTLATALLLVCGLGVFYSLVVRHAFAEDNAVLADKISALSADFHESGSNVFAEELKARRGGEHPAYWIRILNPQRRTYAETPRMDRLLPPGS